MPKNQQLDISFPFIENHFDKSEIKAFTENAFRAIFERNRAKWKIPTTKYAKQVLNYLVGRAVMSTHAVTNNADKTKVIYSWKTGDEYSIISGLKGDSYYTHYTAVYMHGLSLQIPKTIYLNHEHGVPRYDERNLTQAAIDNAFKQGQRKSATTYAYKDKTIILTNGKYTGKLGVLKHLGKGQFYEYTDLERTLIDIAVRPVYSGGVFEVLEAYKRAKAKVNALKIANYLDQLNYIYPYHQVVGFYMEKAGYAEEDLKHFETGMEFDFYLTYNMRSKDFSDKWRLYYPKGL